MLIPTNESAEKPTGSAFTVYKFPFKDEVEFELTAEGALGSKFKDWPVVYILMEGHKAYVGQTTSIATRVRQHFSNPDQIRFKDVAIINNDEFNASVITDYEHRLIDLMNSDDVFTITNRNGGMTRSNYFSKEIYGAMFHDLWETLRGYRYANHTIQELEESDLFKYSPYKALNADQTVALEEIMKSIKRGLKYAEPIVVEGMPGTGKTVLAVYLLKMLKDDPELKGKSIKLMEPLPQLRETLQDALKNVPGINSKTDIIGPFEVVNSHENIDILLVDETHKLKQRKNIVYYQAYDKACKKLGMDKDSTQLDWVLKKANLPIFFYDPLQSTGPSCISAEEMEKKIGKPIEHPIVLGTQMRVKGGDDYLHYISSILDGEKPELLKFETYDFVLHEDFDEFHDSFKQALAKNDLTRMLAGYAWEWKSKKKKDAFDIHLGSRDLRWNSTNNNWVGKGLANSAIANEVGCVHSIQGYDLSNAYVIIGEEIRYNPNTNRLEIDSAKYYDKNGKNGASQEDLQQYIRNVYYVLLTRGIFSTHVYVVDPELRKYLRQFFSEIEKGPYQKNNW